MAGAGYADEVGVDACKVDGGAGELVLGAGLREALVVGSAQAAAPDALGDGTLDITSLNYILGDGMTLVELFVAMRFWGKLAVPTSSVVDGEQLRFDPLKVERLRCAQDSSGGRVSYGCFSG